MGLAGAQPNVARRRRRAAVLARKARRGADPGDGGNGGGGGRNGGAARMREERRGARRARRRARSAGSVRSASACVSPRDCVGKPVEDQVDGPAHVVVGELGDAQGDGVGEGELAHGERRLDALPLDKVLQQRGPQNFVVASAEDFLGVGAHGDDTERVGLVHKHENAMGHNRAWVVQQPVIRFDLL